MADSLSEQADREAIEQIKRDRPSSFTVHVATDGHSGEGGITFDRHWSNGWGATAYLKGWWHDAAVIPRASSGAVIGIEGTKKF